MAGNADMMAETFRRASDNELVSLLASRTVEQSAADQLTTVSLEDGLREGFSDLLHNPVEGELSPDVPDDPVLNALKKEVRRRIAERFRDEETQ